MHLVQILLPLYDNDRHPFPRHDYDQVALDLTQRFGGVTSYTRSPAEGRWLGQGHSSAEEVVVIEVMVEALDEAWWREYRTSLETRFRQQQVVVRAQSVKLL
ncbi:MAG: hypothetical protein ACT4N2_02385 [Hyphomicrobium sp.]